MGTLINNFLRKRISLYIVCGQSGQIGSTECIEYFNVPLFPVFRGQKMRIILLLRRKIIDFLEMLPYSYYFLPSIRCNTGRGTSKYFLLRTLLDNRPDFQQIFRGKGVQKTIRKCMWPQCVVNKFFPLVQYACCSFFVFKKFPNQKLYFAYSLVRLSFALIAQDLKVHDDLISAFQPFQCMACRHT